MKPIFERVREKESERDVVQRYLAFPVKLCSLCLKSDTYYYYSVKDVLYVFVGTTH